MTKVSNLYVLSPSIKYRREQFGGLVYSKLTHSTRFFNHAACFAIEQFIQPNSFESVQNLLEKLVDKSEDQYSFLRGLDESGIIEQANSSTLDWYNSEKNKGPVFFTDITAFPSDRFYTPIGVELELTLKCMRRCSYCAYDSSPDVDTARQLSHLEYKELLNQFTDLGVFYLRFTGGDPLTRPDCLDILSDADKLDFAIALGSDLTVLTEEQAKRLGRLNNLTALQTTLDGSVPEIADRLRGRGNFKQVMRGISLLSENSVPLIVGTVLTKLNVNDIYNIAKLLSKWDLAYCVSPLYDSGRAISQKDLIPDDEELAYAYEQFADAVREGLIRPADPGWKPLAADLPSDKRYSLWKSQPWLLRVPDRLLRIDPWGRCYTSIHLKEILGDEVYVGKWPECDLMELWNSAPLLNELREASQSNPYFGNVVDIRQLQKLQGEKQ